MLVGAHDDVRTGFPGDGKQFLKVFAGYGDGILDQQLIQRFCRGIVPLPSIFKNTEAYWITAILKEQVVLDEFILVSAAGRDTLICARGWRGRLQREVRPVCPKPLLDEQRGMESNVWDTLTWGRSTGR
jgi:hypothetical protein